MTQKQRTLLVPGTQATVLTDGTGKRVYNAVRVGLQIGRRDLGKRDPDEVGRLLAMEHVPGQLKATKTSLEAGTFILKGEVVKVPYDGLSRTDEFRYDWRADLRYNALRLLALLRDEAKNGQRWNLIGHSQGGLIIVLASKLAESPREFATLVGRVALVGTPLAGTVRALDALLFGREDLGAERLRGILAAARTWPALYQMLPAWRAAVTPTGEELPFEKQFIFSEGWAGHATQGIQADLLQRARETQALLRGPFSYMSPGVEVLVLFGKRQDTPTHVERDGDIFSQDYSSAAGDSLVPELLTGAFLGEAAYETRISVSGNIKAHAMLCADPEIQSRIRKFLKKPLPPLPTA